MTPRQLELVAAIEAAFAGVELGAGVSLRQTAVLDAYGGEAELEAARRLDETRDWRRLLADPELARLGGHSGVCFLDAEGLRFHIPAWLTLGITDPQGHLVFDAVDSLVMYLTDQIDDSFEHLAILSCAQRRCVRDAMVYLDGVYDFGYAEFDAVIAGYWSAGD